MFLGGSVVNQRFGDSLRQYRINAGFCLRSFCKEAQIDAKEWLEVERSRLIPQSMGYDWERLFMLAKIPRTEWDGLLDRVKLEQPVQPRLVSDLELAQNLPLALRCDNAEPNLEGLVDVVRNVLSYQEQNL